MISDQVHEFSRGASFEAILSLPTSIAENYFALWTPTSQIRQAGKLTVEGLIGNLTFSWLDGRKFMLVSNDTASWPLGAAELDVLFTEPNTGRKIRTKKLYIDIQHGVTVTA